jgi:coiled-coil domain-containing protein 77
MSENPQLTLEKIEQIDKERLFKLAYNEESEANTLLAFYRDRIHNFDLEREEWLQKLELVKMSQQEQHKTQWEL